MILIVLYVEHSATLMLFCLVSPADQTLEHHVVGIFFRVSFSKRSERFLEEVWTDNSIDMCQSYSSRADINPCSYILTVYLCAGEIKHNTLQTKHKQLNLTYYELSGVGQT